jgi:hypothetical protein
MSGLGDSLTIGILLTLVFGAVCFYLYSRFTQTEKRVSLLENLLLSLKMSTEASLSGPDSVEPVSSPEPLESEDVDEEEYSELLKDLPTTTPNATPASEEQEGGQEEVAAAELLRSIDTAPTSVPERKMDANYESMSLKELQGLARQRGLTGVPQRKRDLIDALKKQGGAPPAAPVPLEAQDGFEVSLEESIDN